MEKKILINKLQWFQEHRQTMLQAHDAELSEIDPDEALLLKSTLARHANEKVSLLQEELTLLYEFACGVRRC